MGRKGWAGSPPADDAEARKWIIDATLRMIDDAAPRRPRCPTSPTRSASPAGPSTATSRAPRSCSPPSPKSHWEASSRRSTSLTADLDVSQSACRGRRAHHRTAATRTAVGAAAGQRSLQHVQPHHVDARRDRALPGDPPARPNRLGPTGFDDRTIDELVEFLLRIIQSMVIAPPEPPGRAPNFAPTFTAGSGRRLRCGPSSRPSERGPDLVVPESPGTSRHIPHHARARGRRRWRWLRRRPGRRESPGSVAHRTTLTR